MILDCNSCNRKFIIACGHILRIVVSRAGLRKLGFRIIALVLWWHFQRWPAMHARGGPLTMTCAHERARPPDLFFSLLEDNDVTLDPIPSDSKL